MLNIYITNLGKYNEGELLGEWVELPISEDELNNVLKRIGINEMYEEYFITDYETDFDYEIGEYDSISKLNDLAYQLQDIKEGKEVIKAMLESGYDMEESIEKFKNNDFVIWSDCRDMSDVAYYYVEESGMLNNVPDGLAQYFDYELFGRDMYLEGDYIFTNNGNCIEILR